MGIVLLNVADPSGEELLVVVSVVDVTGRCGFVESGEYYGAAEPPVRCGESHLSGLTEPPQFVY